VDDCKNLSDHEALIRRIAQQRRTSSWNLQKRSCFIGLKANFVHEMDLDMDVGALGVAAGRDSTLGLSGGFGEVRLGRSYTPLFSTI
jgi:predicted porin